MPTNTIPQSRESKTDFEVCFVITNGIIKRRFLWITCRKSGFYFAFASKGGGHQTYHSDGTSHFKLDDGTKIPDFNKRTPFDQIKGAEFFTNIGIIITDPVLDQFNAPEFDDKRFDSIIYIDNRKTGILNAAIYLVEPFKLGEIPIMPHPNFQLHIFTKQTPWLAISTYEQMP